MQVQINPRAADEAGIFVALGGMAHEVGGFVDGEEIGVFVDDGEKFFQTRGSLPQRHRGTEKKRRMKRRARKRREFGAKFWRKIG